EINYKRKKVLAATYGRGLWEADLCLPVSNSAITITENTVWERDKNMLHDVIIAAGATLTITATIEMGDDRTIKVMPGGQLIINGGKLTANCINLWQGIRLYGHADFGDTTLPQAKLSMNYGATIEKARIAVECMAVNDTAHSCPQGGGVIYANRSYFTNNIQSILMHPGIGINPSEFKFCRFTNNELIEGQGPEAQVELNGIQGVHFTSCQFENLIPVNLIQLPDRGCGIRSFNSWFVVSKAVVNDSLPFAPSADPLFKQFNCGIDARFSHPGYALVLDGIRFDRNYTGVYISGAGLANISNCKIKTLQSGSTGNYKPVSAGIYLDHCNLYNISLNQFTGNVSGLAPLLFPSAAMIINNCGAANNLISGNKINKCSVGLMAQNQNRSPDGSNGLRVLNNWFNSNIFDVAITADSSEVNVGIALRQGSLPSGETAPAGNHFSYSRHQREGDFRNQGPDIRYYCYNDSLMHQLPRMYARISPVPVAVSFPGDSTYLPSWITDIPDMEKLETWDRITETIQDRQKELVDGGDTPGLQLRTIAHMGDDSPDFFKTLNRYSPYLSYPVIQALVKNNYFPNKMLLEILLKNCHSVRLPGLLELLKQRFPEMPGWMQYNLVNCYQQYSGLEHLESEVEMSKAIRNGVYNLASANLFLQESPDDIPQAWQSILYKQNTVESELSRAFSSLFAGDTTLAPGILLNAGYIDESSDYNTEEWLSIYKLNLKIIYDNLNCLPDSLLMNELTNSNSPMHTFYLKNLLHHLDVVTYHEPYIFPGKLPGVILPEIPDPAINSTFIEVYPVPAQSFFILNYQSDTGLEAAGIQIFDLNGRQLDFIALNKEYDQKFIPVSHLKSGIYILRIRLNAHTTIYRKLLIAR
ncbi:MAG: T9SS type A sorting domain-containing protein, partial [Lentimicrobiaceae bacterium]|nr:T9SS type A sorting domain-containing protein [Lentimicrobiaceae bacterium]